jgi:hypothetical protein
MSDAHETQSLLTQKGTLPNLDVIRPNPSNFYLSKAARYCMLLNLLCGVSEAILAAPLAALYEQSLCFSYHEIQNRSNISSFEGSRLLATCQILPIQQQLAKITGWKSVFDALPGEIARSSYIFPLNHHSFTCVYPVW